LTATDLAKLSLRYQNRTKYGKIQTVEVRAGEKCPVGVSSNSLFTNSLILDTLQVLTALVAVANSHQLISCSKLSQADKIHHILDRFPET
jgi:hypothetical protein